MVFAHAAGIIGGGRVAARHAAAGQYASPIILAATCHLVWLTEAARRNQARMRIAYRRIGDFALAIEHRKSENVMVWRLSMPRRESISEKAAVEAWRAAWHQASVNKWA